MLTKIVADSASSNFISIRPENWLSIKNIQYTKEAARKDSPIKEAVETLLKTPQPSIFWKLFQPALKILPVWRMKNEFILTHHPEPEVKNYQ